MDLDELLRDVDRDEVLRLYGEAAEELLQRPGIPVGVVYREDLPTIGDRLEEINSRVKARSVVELMDSYAL